MIEIRNIIIPLETNPILADLFYEKNHGNTLVVFCHGFKGFKDWGAWNLVAREFAKAGFLFLKFNFSHNGVGQEQVQDFTRLDLFFENNYTKELEDLEMVLDWTNGDEKMQELGIEKIYLIGHSRGGGIVVQGATNNPVVSKLATWASISHFDRFGDEQTKADWRSSGYRNFFNGRTQQDMKIGYQFYEDYQVNRDQLDLEKAASGLKKPYLIAHGKNDDSVGFSHAQRLKKWNPEAELLLIDGANHVFGAKHPYTEEFLSGHLQEVVDETIKFFS
jgi:pimeloyl-ACP methyl ester carboxylesterase